MSHYRIEEEKTVFDDHLVIEKALVRKKDDSYSRTRVKRPAGSAVLLYNRDEDCVILTRQFRYPIHSETKGNIYEIAAGIIDKNEEPEVCAVREVLEETGYKIKKEDLRLIACCFVSPGYSSEKLYHFYAEVNNNSKIKKGGGLEEEHEEIEIVSMPRKEFEEGIKTQKFKDAKTLLSGYWFLMNVSEAD